MVERQARRSARVRAVKEETPSIRSIELEPADGGEWPEFEAGAHIDLELPNGLVRQYSLINPGQPARYRIAVLRERKGKGGSAYIFDSLHEGDEVRVGGPRNNFPLVPGSRPVCLIAGGIGVTPLLAMARTLAGSDRPWRLHYCVRDEDGVGFRDLLQQLGPNVRLHIDADAGGPPSLDDIIRAESTSDYYCCGPRPMLDAFREATAALPAERVNLESFDPVVLDGAEEKSFEIELKRSGLRLTVPSDKSIIDVLEEAGIHVLYSCRNGQCGTCETVVLDGIPDHRDSVLTDKEKGDGNTMMVCCSRAKTDELLLDL